MFKQTYIVFLLVTAIGFSQKKNIEFQVQKEEKALLIKGLNNTNEALEITLTISDIKMLKGYTKPITKIVQPQSKALFIKLTFDYDIYNYKLSYTFKKLETETQKKIKAYNKEAYYLKDLTKIDEGIVIFDDTGCGNCRLVTNYLVANDIDFKIIDLSEDKANTKFMWKTIKQKGASLKVKLPVIVVNGEISHSHKDFNTFLRGLKK